MDRQGGKKFGQLKKTQEMSLDQINEIYLQDPEYVEEYPNLAELLQDYKKQVKCPTSVFRKTNTFSPDQ